VSATSEQIIQQALALPLKERAELIEQLLATFEVPPDPTLNELWATEAHDRLDAYNRGELGLVNVEEVFKQIDEREE
jgi:putative addiction module component (TIGR02574 family)